LSFDGNVEIAKRQFGTAAEARAVLSAWQERYGADFRELQWRYEKVREIA
jgi:hypothetical protein